MANKRKSSVTGSKTRRADIAASRLDATAASDSPDFRVATKAEMSARPLIRKRTGIKLSDGSHAIIYHFPLSGRQMMEAMRAEKDGAKGLTPEAIEAASKIVAANWLDPETKQPMWSMEEVVEFPFLQVTLEVLRAISSTEEDGGGSPLASSGTEA